MKGERQAKIREVWLAKIETKELALRVIKECSYGFYCVAALGVLASFFIRIGYLVDAVLFIILAFLLQKFKSRIAAIALSLLSLMAIIFTITNALRLTKGGTNIFLAIMLFWISIRAIQATFKLRKLEQALLK